MKITNDTEYRRALDRTNALRASGASPEDSVELSELDAAIARYEEEGDGLGGALKGRPGARDTRDAPE